jgi:HlyD family secretion protein
MGGVSRQSVGQFRADRRSAEAKGDAAQAALEQARAPMGREGEIQAQIASVAAARAALGMAEWRLGQRRVTAPVSGRVADVLARPGETMVHAGGRDGRGMVLSGDSGLIAGD